MGNMVGNKSGAGTP